MLASEHTTRVEILKRLDTVPNHWCQEAVLLSVTDGPGALAIHWNRSGYGDEEPTCALTLNGIPLMNARLPGCPTCEGMLAAGYGVENAGCAQLQAVSGSLNGEYLGIQNAAQALMPLLALLESGLYVLADARMYPADGNGRFFWDMPKEPAMNPATAEFLTQEGDYVEGYPSFLYASQSAGRFDEERVQYYMRRFAGPERRPRALAYSFHAFVSVLLDGHHKAAAAALLGQQVCCLVIIPMTAVSSRQERSGLYRGTLYFSTIQVDEGELPPELYKRHRKAFENGKGGRKIKYRSALPDRRLRDAKYDASARRYPTARELAECAALGIGPVPDEMVASCLADLGGRHQHMLRLIISYFAREKDARLKGLALQCARLRADPPLAEAAFRALAQIRGDGDVERFLLEYLVSHTDRHDMLLQIAEGYFAEDKKDNG